MHDTLINIQGGPDLKEIIVSRGRITINFSDCELKGVEFPLWKEIGKLQMTIYPPAKKWQDSWMASIASSSDSWKFYLYGD